jgi:hypothetical protein
MAYSEHIIPFFSDVELLLRILTYKKMRKLMMTKIWEQEIECPRCNDIMTLTSDFDKLGYTCQECDLLLVMK